MKHERPDDESCYRFLKDQMARFFCVKTGPPVGWRGRYYGWYWGYYGRAALEMYQASGDERFRDLVRETSLRLLELRDDKLGLVDDARGTIFPGWGYLYKNDVRTNGVTITGLITLPMCQYAVATGDEEIGRAAVEALEAFIPERMDTGKGEYYFMHRSSNVVEALNHSNLYGAALAHCSLLRYAPASFRETALGIHLYFLRFVSWSQGSLSWPYAPKPNDSGLLPPEAVWKASATVELPIALFNTGLVNDREYFQSIASVISNNSVFRAGQIPKNIGEDQNIPMDARYDGTSLAGLLMVWLLLDEQNVREVLLSSMRNHPEKFPNGWYGGSRAMIMGHAHLRARGL